eukprot:5879804-Amphidinium_carterae.1
MTWLKRTSCARTRTRTEKQSAGERYENSRARANTVRGGLYGLFNIWDEYFAVRASTGCKPALGSG